MRRALLPILLGLASLASAQISKPAKAQAAADGPPIPLGMENLKNAPWGPLVPEYGMEITANAPSPADLVNRGLYQLQLFRSPQAARHFLAALREDTTCAMAWTGLYLALLETGESAAPVRETCVKIALARRDACNPHEQAWLDALQALHQRGAGGFALALETIRQRFPSDHNAKIWLPMMLRDGYDGANEPRAGQRAAEALLSLLLAKRPDDPIVLHAWCQLALVGPKPEVALGQARLLDSLDPPSPYFRQAAGMVMYRCGDSAGAAAAFDSARRFEEKALADEGIAPVAAPTYFDNLDCLAIALIECGRRDDALTIARAARSIHMPWKNTGAAAIREFAVFTLTAETRIHLRCGTWDKALEALPPAEHPAIKALPFAACWVDSLRHFGEGQQAIAASNAKALHAALKGSEDNFATLGKLATEGARTIKNPRWSEVLQLADMMQYELRAAEKLLAKDREGANTWWRSAAAKYPEGFVRAVPRWPLAPDESMAAGLAGAGDLPAAVQIWEQAARARPHAGWILRGLMLSRQAAGDTPGAESAGRALHAAWPDADAGLLPGK